MGRRTREFPLRRIIDREMSFQSTEDFPDGWINETLACGHIFKNAITREDRSLSYDPEDRPRIHRAQTERRRCVECGKKGTQL
jgi:hypothetical protein